MKSQQSLTKIESQEIFEFDLQQVVQLATLAGGGIGAAGGAAMMRKILDEPSK